MSHLFSKINFESMAAANRIATSPALVRSLVSMVGLYCKRCRDRLAASNAWTDAHQVSELELQVQSGVSMLRFLLIEETRRIDGCYQRETAFATGAADGRDEAGARGQEGGSATENTSLS
jgi:hypothetical protein